MQFAVITGPTATIATPRIRQANTLRDGIELRLDLFTEVTFEEVEIMRKAATKKVLFTLRKKILSVLSDVLILEPDYVDLEYDTDYNFLKTVRSKIITSYHDFVKTPDDLEGLLKKIQNPYAYAYKICTTATNVKDSLRMLEFIKRISKTGVKIIGICMGEEGIVTRQEGIKAGNYLNYTILHEDDSCAPGLKLVKNQTLG